MADVHDASTRSRNMAAVRGSDTRPELILRRGLHAKGFRFRLHDRRLPGCPDIVLAKYHAVILAHGCFWHGHECTIFRWPATREAFWRAKIEGNVARDILALAALRAAGWRTGVVWECALRGRGRLGEAEVIDTLTTWLSSGSGDLVIEESR